MTATDAPLYDTYRSCDRGCTHDLARGVLVDDLRDRDGPETQLFLIQPVYQMMRQVMSGQAARR